MASENITKNNYKPDPRLKKVARFSAVAILVGILLLILTGWGITQTGVIFKISFGLIDRGVADAIHRGANAPITFFFLLHVLINVKIAIAQSHPSRAWLTNSILIAVGVALMVIMVYMEYFRLGG